VGLKDVGLALLGLAGFVAVLLGIAFATAVAANGLDKSFWVILGVVTTEELVRHRVSNSD
jgi:hypothetical protein